MKIKIIVPVILLVFMIFSLFFVLFIRKENGVVKKTALYIKTLNKDKELFYNPKKIIKHNNEFYVMDYGNNRIVILDKDGNYIREIGRIGQGPGEFFNPVDFVINSNNEIVVLDLGNSRIQILDINGKYISDFRVAFCSGWTELECDSEDNIYINNPHKGFLFEVYTKEGKKIKEFGKLIKFKNPGVKLKNNVVSFMIDRNDCLYTVFPCCVLRKYYKFRLVKELTIENKDIDIAKSVRKKYKKYFKSENVVSIYLSLIHI